MTSPVAALFMRDLFTTLQHSLVSEGKLLCVG